jgi:replication-associated recombination protein RarA
MNQGKLVRTKNVIEAERCVEYLLNRPKMEMVGLGMLYGKPGLGKTTYASRIAFSRGYVYLRLEASTRPKNFAQQLLMALNGRYALGEYLEHGSTNTLFKRCLGILEEHEDAIIVIDEIDYALPDPKLLGMIRDIVDETLAIVLLVGMQGSRDKLLQINEYYFDRCNIFYEFEPLGKADIGLLCKEVMEIKCAPEIVEYVHFHACGNLRKTIKILHGLEASAREKGLTRITLNDVEN